MRGDEHRGNMTDNELPRDSAATLNSSQNVDITVDESPKEGELGPVAKDGIPLRDSGQGRGLPLIDSEQRTVINLAPNDPALAHNWSTWKKAYTSALMIAMTLNSTFSSCMPSGCINVIAEHFNVTNELQLVMPISVFLIGYVIGPLFLSPLTEVYGRAPVLKLTWFSYVCWCLGSALAPTWPGFLVFRFLAGTSASAPMSINGSVFADLFKDPRTRGRAMSLFSAGTTMGPAIAPIVAGFAGRVAWNWPFWIILIVGGFTLILEILFFPETFEPVIVAKRVKRMRKEQNRDDFVAPLELENVSLKQMYSVTLSRPALLLIEEPIVIVTCWYMALGYAILHLEHELRKSPTGELTPEARRLGVAALGGPCIVLTLFWLGWTSNKSTHWMCPIVSGYFFGLGMSLIFTSLMSYQTDIYGIYSGACLAAASCLRSITGALMPLAARKMYDNLGICWGSSLLGFIVVAMLPIPYVLGRYAGTIRAISPFYKELISRQAEVARTAEGRDFAPGDAEEHDVSRSSA
ncbi:hypothetical protein KEM54_006720 [Ascosphaera aggregata]|nr:hypothetical protein KEM54_006720 [Ascosphaera aggregata]